MKRTKRRRRRRRRTRKKGSGLWAKFKNWRKGRGWREPQLIVLHHGQNAREVEPTVNPINHQENTEIVGFLQGRAPPRRTADKERYRRAASTGTPPINQSGLRRDFAPDWGEIRKEKQSYVTYIGQGANRKLVVSPYTRPGTPIVTTPPLDSTNGALRAQLLKDGKTSPVNDDKKGWWDLGFKHEKYKEPKKREKDLAQHAMKLEFGGTRKIRKRRKRRKRYRRSRRRRRRKKR